MWSDNEASQDFLNFRSVADTAAELIVRANGQPLSVGVSGGWGVGKSSMLKLIESSLSERNKKQYLIVNFNAWLYQGYDDTRAALLEVIAGALIEHGREHKGNIEKAKNLLSRVNWLRFASLTAGSALAMVGGLPPVGLLGLAFNALKGLTDGDITKRDINQAVSVGEKVAVSGAGLLKEEESPPRQIAEIRKQFRETLEALNVTLVVFVDDLDRCLPSTAIATLEAIRLFLFLEHTAFIIAADDRMIRQAVKVHFKDTDITEDLVTNYFDKLIQIPLRVPPLGTQEVRAYMMLLFVQNAVSKEKMIEIRSQVCGRLAQSWQGKRVDTEFMLGLLGEYSNELRANLELADRLAPMMTTSKQIAGNPRLIKRFLNTLAIRMAMARTQNVVVEESTLAKMLIFERCGTPEAYTELTMAINNGEGGQPMYLADWEQQAVAGEPLRNLSKSWESDFAKEWFALAPALANLDLRPVLYVSREHTALVTTADQLSSAAAGILEALLGQLKRVNTTLVAQVKTLPGREITLIMERLLVRAKQQQRWGTPDILYACLTVTEAEPSQSGTLVRFLELLPTNLLQPDIVQLLSDKKWAKQVLLKWSTSAGVSNTVKKAITNLNEAST